MTATGNSLRLSRYDHCCASPDVLQLPGLPHGHRRFGVPVLRETARAEARVQAEAHPCNRPQGRKGMNDKLFGGIFVFVALLQLALIGLAVTAVYLAGHHFGVW